jgi:hypothetical protein
MKSLLSQIASLRSKLADIASGLALAERRVAHFKKRARLAENPQHPHPKLLHRADRRLHYWREKERKAYLRRNHLRVALKRALKKLAKQGPRVQRIDGKLCVRGGTAEERIVALFTYAVKHWVAYYSESGAYDEDHSLNNHDHDGKRRDCSWQGIEARRACGLPTIDFEPRFTGSALECKKVSRRYAETHAGVWVIYGSGEGFHMGTSTGHGPFVWQHGTPTLSTGHFDEFGPGTEVRYRAMPNR